MTRKNPPARYTLPDVPVPSTFRCYQVNVPDDPMHIAAFQGQIKALASAYTWQNDPDHTALLAASAWQPIFDGICLDPSPCGIEVPSILCISGSFADDTYGYVPAIAAACSANWVSGTGYESCPDPADSNRQTLELLRIFTGSTFVRSAEYHFQRDIGDGYDLSIDFFLHGVSAYHFDDTVPAGGGYTFSQSPNVQADAVVIAVVANDLNSNIILLDDWSLCYTGDFPMSQPPTVWTSFFDFTVSDYGWTIDHGVYTAGVGFEGNLAFGANIVAQIELSVATVHIESAIMVYSMSGGTGGSQTVRLGFVIGGTFQNTFLIHSGVDGTHRSFGGAVGDDITFIDMTLNTGQTGGSNTIESLTLTGTGTKPSSFP